MSTSSSTAAPSSSPPAPAPRTAGAHGTIGRETPGLVGVTANGTDVYFSTYDTLVPEDHNGNFLKFYDARTNGGFPQPPPRQPCAAAEECHGPGTEAPALPTQGTAATSHRRQRHPRTPREAPQKAQEDRQESRRHKRPPSTTGEAASKWSNLILLRRVRDGI